MDMDLGIKDKMDISINKNKRLDYFLLEQIDYVSIGNVQVTILEEAVICKVGDISPLDKIDYIADKNLISDRLKSIFEFYLPKHKWTPYAFIDTSRSAEKTFWKLTPEMYAFTDSKFRADGFISGLFIAPGEYPPAVFGVKSPKGIISSVVHISVAESILRRKFLGVRLCPLMH